MLTSERLKHVLSYDKKTGVFIWNNPLCTKLVKGDEAGTSGGGGNYIVIGIDGNRYLAHRLAWFYMYGYFPEGNIDHIDRNGKNNSIDNLRHVSHQCNMRNTGNRSTNTSGVRGVVFRKHNNDWRAQITVNGKNICLGCHGDFNEAVCHRLAGEQAENWSGCDSSSPAYKYVADLVMLLPPEHRKSYGG